MELEFSSNASAHAHGEEKHKMKFRNEQVCSVCQCDGASPSHVGSWKVLGTAQLLEATAGPAEVSLWSRTA